MIWQIDRFLTIFLIIFILCFVLIIDHQTVDRKKIVQLFLVCLISTFSILCLSTKSLCFKNSTLTLRRFTHQFSFRILLPKCTDKKTDDKMFIFSDLIVFKFNYSIPSFNYGQLTLGNYDFFGKIVIFTQNLSNLTINIKKMTIDIKNISRNLDEIISFTPNIT